MLFDIGANLTHSDFKGDLLSGCTRPSQSGGCAPDGGDRRQLRRLATGGYAIRAVRGLVRNGGRAPTSRRRELTMAHLRLLAALAASATGRGHRRDRARLFSRFYAEGPAAPGFRSAAEPLRWQWDKPLFLHERDAAEDFTADPHEIS